MQKCNKNHVASENNLIFVHTGYVTSDTYTESQKCTGFFVESLMYVHKMVLYYGSTAGLKGLSCTKIGSKEAMLY